MVEERILHCQDVIKIAKQSHKTPIIVVAEDTPAEVHNRNVRLVVLLMIMVARLCLYWLVTGVMDLQGRFHDKDLLWYFFLYKKLASGAWAPECTSAVRIKSYLAYKGYRIVWPKAK